MILHADHEQNASTSTVRISGSSQVWRPSTHTTDFIYLSLTVPRWELLLIA